MKYLTLLILLAGCSLTFEKTTIDGNDDKVEEKSIQKDKSQIKANVKVPIV